MTDEVQVEAPKATVYFERKVGLPDYSNVVAGVHIQVPTNPGDDMAAIAEAVQATFFSAKALVYQELQIVTEVDSDNLLIEKAARQLGAVEVGGTPTRSATKAVSAPADKANQWAELVSDPKKWFDNRENKKNPNGPDFKRKGHGDQPALWLTYKGASQVPEGIELPDPAAFV